MIAGLGDNFMGIQFLSVINYELGNRYKKYTWFFFALAPSWPFHNKVIERTRIISYYLQIMFYVMIEIYILGKYEFRAIAKYKDIGYCYIVWFEVIR